MFCTCSAGHLRRNDSTVSSDTHQQRASHAAVDASYPELERNHTFYSRASQKRQQVVAGRSRNNIADAAEEYTSGTCSDGHHSATSRSGVPPVPPVPVMLTADPLRRILEDYLEVDSSANPRLQQLLNAGLLARYFRRTVFPELEVLYDTHQTAHKARHQHFSFASRYISDVLSNILTF